MDWTHQILWGLLTFAIGSMATWLYKDKSSISRSEMKEEIAAHYRACMEAKKAALFEKFQTAFRQHLENVFSFYGRFCSDVENATTEQELEMLKQKLTSSWSLYD